MVCCSVWLSASNIIYFDLFAFYDKLSYEFVAGSLNHSWFSNIMEKNKQQGITVVLLTN